jgi:hypothetical protein
MNNPISAPIPPKTTTFAEHMLSGLSQVGLVAFAMNPLATPAPAPTATQNSAPFRRRPLVVGCSAAPVLMDLSFD